MADEFDHQPVPAVDHGAGVRPGVGARGDGAKSRPRATRSAAATVVMAKFDRGTVSSPSRAVLPGAHHE